MKRNILCIGLAALFLLLGACGTLDKQECLAGNWEGVGYYDGAKGRRPDVFTGLHNRACTKHGVAVNEVEYERGHNLGLADFCQPGTGYRMGRSGERYNYLCPLEFQEEFLTAYVEGLTEALYRARSFEYYASTRATFVGLGRSSSQGGQGDSNSAGESGAGNQSAQRSSRAGNRSDNARHRRIQIEIMLDGALSRLQSLRSAKVDSVSVSSEQPES